MLDELASEPGDDERSAESAAATSVHAWAWNVRPRISDCLAISAAWGRNAIFLTTSRWMPVHRGIEVGLDPHEAFGFLAVACLDRRTARRSKSAGGGRISLANLVSSLFSACGPCHAQPARLVTTDRCGSRIRAGIRFVASQNFEASSVATARSARPARLPDPRGRLSGVGSARSWRRRIGRSTVLAARSRPTRSSSVCAHGPERTSSRRAPTRCRSPELKRRSGSGVLLSPRSGRRRPRQNDPGGGAASPGRGESDSGVLPRGATCMRAAGSEFGRGEMALVNQGPSPEIRRL